MAAEAKTDRYAVAKAALSQIPHPVAIIGAAHGAERSCATGTAMYVSLSPALVAIAEHPGSRTARLIAASGEFSVSFLHAAQQEIAFAAGKSAQGPDKFETLKVKTEAPPDGFAVPGVADSIAVLWCRVRDSRTTGDHALFIGEVLEYKASGEKVDALLRFRRRYWDIGHWTSDESPEGYPT